MSDLVFYDTEATDADVRHGQITQFGGIRTDLDFNILEETEFRVKRLPWVIPSPVALDVTKMQAADLDRDDSISEYEAAEKMEKFLVPEYGKSRTLVTFRGPSFDDELIRTTLFRNLRSPWFFSGKMTGRLDVFNLVRLAKTINPEALVVPMGEEGKLTWRLEKLCEANGIPLDAHDALADAYGTLKIAALIRDTTPEAWDTMMRCSSPTRQEALLESTKAAGKPMLLFQYFSEPRVIPCVVLGTNDQKGWILADITSENIPTTASEIRDSLFSMESKFPIVKSNMAPMFLDRNTALAIDPTLDFESIIAKSKEIKWQQLSYEAVKAYKDTSYDNPEDMTSEEKIYSGFIDNKERPKLASFHKADSWQKKMSVKFSDERLKDFKARIILDAIYNGKTSLPEGDEELLRVHCAEALARPFAGAESRFMTIKKALEIGVTQDWADWAKEKFNYDIDPDFIKADTENQMSFAL